MQQLTITQPDDWHLHVRTGDILKTVIAHSAMQFGRAIIMPNLNPPVTTVDQALNYRSEIIQAIPKEFTFKPLMTLYLTNETTPGEIITAAKSKVIHACKLYPAGATTNSASGVTDLKALYPVLEAMQREDLPLLIHGEVTDDKIDIFDREKIFIDTCLSHLVTDFPRLRIVLEHVTTTEAVQFVQQANVNVAATITPQHLMFNRNAILVGGIQPHRYCLPILKRETHRQALISAATSGNRKFFLGTDSAPHLRSMKENSCGCAGCYSAAAAMEMYTEVFEQADALENLEAFASFHGADFYRLPRNKKTVTLKKSSWTLPAAFPIGNDQLIPLNAGKPCLWKLTT
jgi:dihydroorotase